MFRFSLQLVSEIFLTVRRIQLGIIINVRKFSWHIFKKASDIKFHENPSSQSRIVSCERTDRRTDEHHEGNSRFLQFYDRV